MRRAAGMPRVTRVATTHLPTRHGDFVVHAYRDEQTTEDHVVLARGDLHGGPGERPPLVRLHSECVTSESLGSLRCDCRDQLEAAQGAIAAEERGAIIYLRGHEGRGIGLAAKLQAYALQDAGLDTVEANLALGAPVDGREYGAAAAILTDLGVPAVRLLSSNPAKETGLVAGGIEVSRIGLHVPARPSNRAYLRAKHERMGHDAAPADDGWDELLHGRAPVTGELAERYGPLVDAGPRLVLGQLGQSLDGFIAARTGDACFVTGAADRAHLHRLRALVDAVVVGVRTVLADDCRLTVRAVAGRNPVRVVLDPNGRMPCSAHVLTAPDAATLWVIAERVRAPTGLPPHVEVLPLPRRGPDGGFAPHEVVAALAGRGLGRLLVEGGGTTVSGFLAAGALDRLMVTTAPVLIGDGIPGLRFEGQDRLGDALRAPARRFLLGEDTCVELDLSRVDGSGPAGVNRRAPRARAVP